MIKTTGVDFDTRCKKYRVRLTRIGIVYLIGYYKTFKEACEARKKAVEDFNNGIDFDYLYSYSTSNIKKQEGEEYFLQINNDQIYNSNRGLIIAVLAQAIKDRLSSNKQISNSVKEWFESKETMTLQFSFLDICNELLIDPQHVHNIIDKALKGKKSQKRLIGRRLVKSNHDIDFS